MELSGATAVVTGASAGIGRATALALAGRGTRVALAARRLQRLQALAAEIEAKGGTALAVSCDVTDRAQVAALVEAVERAFGHLDVLVNNAGVPGGGRFDELSWDQVEQVVRVNLLGVLACTHAFLPLFRRQGRGHIVNVASLAGRFATPGTAVYTATKHAVVAFSESLFHELRPHGVLVTAVNPGFVRTEGFPQTHLHPRLVMSPERVARAIVKVLREGRAPEYSVPRWVAPLQLFRILAPPLYRWGVATAATVAGGGTPAGKGGS